MAEITGVLLAAGFSTRFGSNKLLHEIDGQPLITYSVATLQPCDRIVAVVRHDTLLLTVLNELGIDCVVNVEPQRGMGHSIACAINATSASSGWCLLPADMPYVKPATTQRLVDAMHEGAMIAAPFCHNQRGHPVAFSNRFYNQLIALDGDSGARTIVDRNVDQLTAIETSNAGVLMDVDTQADVEQAEPQTGLACRKEHK
jgi:molybdenum cofactor cytidylyltransferase